jgi:hypothetical protein
MRVWMAAVAVLALGAGTARAQDCNLKQYESLTMEVWPNVLLLPVTFGTVPKKLVFRLDDAASGIAADSAEELGMRYTSTPPNIVFHRDGQKITRIAHPAEMHLGGQILKNMEFLVTPSTPHPPEVAGDLGTYLFQKMDLELDIAGGKLNLFSPDHCPGQTVYWTKTGFAQLPLKLSKDVGYIRAEVVLDGKPITVAFSTIGRSRIGMNAMRRFFNVDETSPDLKAVDEDLLGHKLYRYAFKTITAGGLTVSNPAILVYDEDPRPGCNDKPHFSSSEQELGHAMEQPRLTRCFGGSDAVLGLSVLSKLHLYVSTKEKMLYITSAGAK